MRFLYLLLILLQIGTSQSLVSANTTSSPEVSPWYLQHRLEILGPPGSFGLINGSRFIPSENAATLKSMLAPDESLQSIHTEPLLTAAQIASGLPQKYLVLEVDAGMGNRLRAIASAEIMARLSKRQLVVRWPTNIHMPGQWQQFFKKPLVTLENSGLPELGYSFEKIQSAKNSDLIRNLGFQTNRTARLDVLPFLYLYEEPIVYLGTTLPFKPCTMNEQEWRKQMTEFYKSLSPNEWIKQEAKAFADEHKFQDYYMVGIHYRGWQMGESDDNPQLTNDPSNKYVRSFIDTMKETFERRRARTDNKPVAFFLAADNQKVKEEIMKEPLFQGRIFTRSVEIERNTVRGQESAMVDFDLLGSTNFIIGTPQSSFSAGAANLTKESRKIEVGDDPYGRTEQ